MATKINPPSLLNPTPIVSQPDAPIIELPHEVNTRILAFLPASQVGAASLVCREWYRKFEQDDTFRTIFSLQFPSIDENTIKNFKKFYHFYSNLINGVHALRTFGGLQHQIESLATIGETLFSGSLDATIKAWNKTGECIATFQGHKKAITFLVAAGETLFSGSRDHAIKGWDIKTGKCIATFEGHKKAITFLAAAGETLFSASRDHIFKTWDIKTGKCIATFEGYKGGLRYLIIGETLFLGSDDNTIKVWDIKTGECTATFKGHKRPVFSLAIVGETLFSGSDDNTIKAWDIKTSECIATFEGHKDSVQSLAVIGQTLFSGSSDGTIKAWNIETGKCIATFQGHKNPVYSLAAIGQTLFSGSEQNTTIMALDFTADHSTIFKEIAQLLEEGTPEATKLALERFSKMPIRARGAICTILHDYLDTGAFCTTDEIKEPTLRPEDIFYDNCLLRKATSAQKAQAIRDYLSLPTPPLAGSSGFSANGKRTHDTAFGTAIAPSSSTSGNI